MKLVRADGTPVADEEFVTADYILPFSDATVAEVRKLLADGTIHGDSLGLALAGPPQSRSGRRSPCAATPAAPRRCAHGGKFAVGAIDRWPLSAS